MFTRSRFTTLPAKILDRYYTNNVYPQSLDNFTRNDFEYYTRNVYPQSLNNFTRNDFE